MIRPLHSFRALLLGTMLGLVIASVALVGAVSYYFSTRTVEEYAGTVTRQALRRVEAHVGDILRSATELNDALRAHAEREQIAPADLPRVLELFAPIFSARRELAYAGLGFEATGDYGMLERQHDGTIMARVFVLKTDGAREIHNYRVTPGGLTRESVAVWNNYDPRTRPFYLQAKEIGRGGWTPTYLFRPYDALRSPTLGVTYAAPWRDPAGRLVGVVDTDLDAGPLSAELRRLHGDVPGRTFIVEERPEGARTLVAHPALEQRPAPAAVMPVDSVDDPAATELMRRVPGKLAQSRSEASTLWRFTAGDGPYAAAATVLEGTEVPPWFIAVMVPRVQIAGDLRHLQIWALVATLLVAAVAVTAAIAVANRMAQSLRRLERRTRALAEDAPAPPLPTDGPLEIQQLDAAFNTMVERVRARQILLVATNASLRQEITDRERAEEEVRSLNAGLEQRVAERTNALARANEKLKELDRLKSEFLATMSHELRTPLHAIIGFTGIVKAGMAGSVNAEQKKQLEMVYDSAKHLLGLINDLLDLSRIESGRMSLDEAEFSPVEVARDVARTLLPMIEAKGIAFHLDAPTDVPMMQSDRKRFFQIALNLAGNAVKFTEHGEVRIRLARCDEGVEIAVSDTGPGIQPDQLGDLFNAFHQLGSAAHRRHEGAGLGLYLCKKLTMLLGGEISVESELGRGTRFRVWLPRTLPRRVATNHPFVPKP